MSIHFPIHSIEDLAEEYVGSQKTGARAISTSAAIRAVRTIRPDTRLTDKELASVIAGKAVACGHAVDFDDD